MAALLGAGWIAVSGGLAGEGDPQPEPRPTARDLAALRSLPEPVWWLGERFRGHRLTAAQRLGTGAGGARPRFAAPQPFDCARLRRVPRWYRARMPAALVPAACREGR